MKNLLVLANISSDNDQLIEYVAAFCKQYRFKLHLLYVSSNRDPSTTLGILAGLELPSLIFKV